MREFWSTLSPTPQGRRNPDDEIEPQNLLSLLVNLTFTGPHNVSGLEKLSEHADSLFILSYVPFHVTSFTSRGEILVSFVIFIINMKKIIRLQPSKQSQNHHSGFQYSFL